MCVVVAGAGSRAAVPQVVIVARNTYKAFLEFVFLAYIVDLEATHRRAGKQEECVVVVSAASDNALPHVLKFVFYCILLTA